MSFQYCYLLVRESCERTEQRRSVGTGREQRFSQGREGFSSELPHVEVLLLNATAMEQGYQAVLWKDGQEELQRPNSAPIPSHQI